MPLNQLLLQHIIRSEEKINKSNLKTFCKACIEELGDEEGHRKWFPNKQDKIIQHFKKCPNFLSKTSAEQRTTIFKLNDNNKRIRKCFILGCYANINGQ